MSLSVEKPIVRKPIALGRAQREILMDPYNRRFKLVGWSAEDVDRVGMPAILAKAEGATKGIVYSRSSGRTEFERLGFDYEATIRGFFSDGGDAVLFSCFLDAQRGRVSPNERVHESLRTAQSKRATSVGVPAAMSSRRAMPEDAHALSAFLAQQFHDYPTRIDAGYLRERISMRDSHFRLCMFDGAIVACASAEIDHVRHNAEVSDCLTDPKHRGKGLSSALIREVEIDVRSEFGTTDFYSLARAGEVGMNCAFAKCGYEYTGRLANNCRMPNGWESIHVWCRSLDG